MAHRDGDAPPRSAAARRDDHAAIDRLADELLPALVAKLAASGLGELDVREGDWRVRLRMPGDARGPRRGAGSTRPAGRGEAHPGAHAAGSHATASHASPAHDAAHAATARAAVAADPDDAGTRAVATSPAVGFFRPRPDLAVGARVRAGDRVGTVDVLGVAQEVVAPIDGLLGAALVEPGDPVEYGQEVVEIELPTAPAVPRPEAG